ncbi:DUF4241 domain-containing protein (plasmid) [Nostoc sp. UHCC 0926]|uniref:DUF4241 domain-containing protein n=1 Tax=Nostoc sp. UHCC 0926 TaxID=3025190 RepID=UPI00235E8925|nr:DUF4241 domain-containing protein [Nostoc sp. UHCC 0926]WDD35971.1 DUF4241 domain-containing protein [Nostoc sp. UHCC 0926]
MTNPDFSKAFQANCQLNSILGIMNLKSYKLGNLILNSNKLVACDPLVFPTTEPFNTNIKPGSYPVIVSVAYNQNNHDPIVAYAMLRFGEQIPTRWEMATRFGEDINSLKVGEKFGYYVDSGIGCFMDAEAGQIIYDSLLNTEIYEETLNGKLDELLEENDSFGFMWANMCIDESTAINVIAFAVGVGDGFYPSYFGYDVENNIVSIVTICLSGDLELIL